MGNITQFFHRGELEFKSWKKKKKKKNLLIIISKRSVKITTLRNLYKREEEMQIETKYVAKGKRVPWPG